MRKVFEKIEQRGTLLVEALAMLGLIAMVTPTLYKKSAERLQEIQDINAASQARTMNNVVETFIKTYFQQLLAETSSASDPKTIKIALENSSNGYFEVGYSSFLPYGYSPDTIKNYKEPKIYVHRDGNSLVSYIVYPQIIDPGRKRAARLASLIGANGGLITPLREAQGTGGAWYLDSSMINDLEIDLSDVETNSLVITANEPIQNSTEDNDKFLYRVESDEEPYHNAMITDLYMGGIPDTTGAYSAYTSPHNFYGIYNVRKLTLNTRCDKSMVGHGAVSGSSLCNPEIADLYIGKPLVGVNYEKDGGRYFGNNAAAWIYGNLSAINEGFKVTSDSSRTAEFVFGPSGEDSSGASYEIIYAGGAYDSSDVEVRLLGEFVKAQKDNAGGYTFSVGSSMASDSDNDMIQAYSDAGGQKVRLGMQKDADVYIAEKGGKVFINAGSDSSSTMVHAVTKINSGGGSLEAGVDGGWMFASGRDDSTTVQMLKNKEGLFVVGASGASDDENMLYADFGGGSSATSSSQISLYGQRLVVKKHEPYNESTSLGGRDGSGYEAKEGLTVVASKYTDVLGSTYMGTEKMNSSFADDGAVYNRGDWTLGVAGSAWVDETLWARRAWLKDAGMKNLHAGFSSYAQFHNSPKTGWLNVYGKGGNDLVGGGVVVRNPDKVVSAGSVGDNSDIMFLANSSYAYMADTEGAFVLLNKGETKVGSDFNYFASDFSGSSDVSGSSYVVGADGVKLYTGSNNLDSSVVDIQMGALKMYGHAGSSGTYANRIKATAGEFGVVTGSTSANTLDDAQLYANSDLIRTRYVNFEVQRDNGESAVVMGVYPNTVANGSANVEIDGSLHITGNDVLHVASGDHNTASEDSSRAMFEIDPNYVRIWARDENGNYANSADYFAMLTINPQDISGSSVTMGTMEDTSIYVRRGAIELEKSSGGSSNTYAADEGFGYIKANRFVSNTELEAPSAVDSAGKYDKYMVNPAYTSVMHDIKLTTRGGARLSDILPDFVLKGVYNVSNDFTEENDGKTERISWSASDWTGAKNGNDVAWASPYLGLIPYGMCPPGYKNMATIVPISFQLGRTGRVVPAIGKGGVDTRAEWQLLDGTEARQARILEAATSVNGGLKEPRLEVVSSLVWNDIYNSSNTFSQFVSDVEWKTEGWYWGVKAIFDEHGQQISGDLDYNSSNVGIYSDGSSSYAIAEPLYFQEGTYLKTSLDPQDKGWEGRMGFIYNKNQWGRLANGLFSEGIRSNNTDGSNDSSNPGVNMSDDYVWNLFPVPTNTLEGHATVYCYFDRSQFDSSHVLQFNAKNDAHDFRDKSKADRGVDYLKRLDDPSLKYNDPW